MPSAIRAKTILVVDDEPQVRAMMERYLGLEGFDVFTAAGGVAMRDVLARRAVDLVILDLIMPGEDGLELTRYLRAHHPGIGILILSAKGDEVDKVVGLELGADDYVMKPFSLREVLARVKSVLRRATSAPAAATGGRGTVSFDQWTLDFDKRELIGAADDRVHLTPAEFDLLRAMVENPNEVLPRERLLKLMRGNNANLNDRSIDVLILRLREKIEVNPKIPTSIKTIRGSGYVFAAPVVVS